MAQNPFKFGSSEYDNWNYEHGGQSGADVALSGAKQFLEDPQGLSQEYSDIDRLAALSMPGKQKGALRQVTEGWNDLGGVLGTAALPGLVPSPYTPIAGVLGTAGGLATIPNYLRREFAPEEGEDSPGLMERGFAALSAAPVVGGMARSLKGLKSLSAADEMLAGAKSQVGRNLGLGSKEMPYRMGSSVQPPSVAALKNPSYAAELERAGNPAVMPDFARNQQAFIQESLAGKFGPEQTAWARKQTNPAMTKFAQMTPEEAFVSELPNVPEFTSTAGQAGIPGLTVGGASRKIPSALERLPGETELAQKIAQRMKESTARSSTRPSHARQVPPAGAPPPSGKSPQQLLNEEALARRRGR